MGLRNFASYSAALAGYTAVLIAADSLAANLHRSNRCLPSMTTAAIDRGGTGHE
jgi:hypothetical protein